MEHIRTPKVENVRLVDRISSKKAALGTLYLTATHVIFVENAPDTRKETWILHSQISTIEKQATTATGCPLLIRCKNFQLLQLVIPQERDCHDVYISLIRLARPVKYEELYCFSFNPKLDREEREQGWMLIDLSEEYKRMGLLDNYWQLSDVNRDYRVCDSYPTELYVPKSATAHIIVGSSKFRSRRRFPALSYYYRDNHASICRSSQPLSGFSARCLEDEQMLQAIRKANPGSDFIYVVDTRPKMQMERRGLLSDTLGEGVAWSSCQDQLQFPLSSHVRSVLSLRDRMYSAESGDSETRRGTGLTFNLI